MKKVIGVCIGIFLLTLSACQVSAASDSLRLVTDGQSGYRVCLAPGASDSLKAAADTLCGYIEIISGARIPVEYATNRTQNRILFDVGHSSNSSLGNDGFRIRSVGTDLVFSSNSNYGLQNAVYSFLETYLGCRKYSPTFAVIPRNRTIALAAIDDTQVPPLNFRRQDYYETSYSNWHKLNSIDQWGLFVHTFKVLVPPERYFKAHPEYFELTKSGRVPNGQLCLANPDVFQIVVEELRARMREKPTARYWSVSQNDVWSSCQCDTCRAIDSAEGSPSGSILAFVNKVADQFPDKTISTLAYQYSRSAPKHITPRPNVNIMLCSIELNRSKPIAEDPPSASFVKDVEDWGKLTHNIMVWDYVIQFRNLVSPFPNLHVLQPNLRFFVQNGITAVFEQGVGELHGEFAELRTYLLAKLLWNPELNLDSVLNDFLQGYYGAAAPYIRKYIDTMQSALAASGETLDIYGYPVTSKTGYLAPSMLDIYERLFQQAENAAKEDTALLERVQTAHLPLQFAFLEQAKQFGTADRGFFSVAVDGGRRIRPEMDSLLQLFVLRCKRAGVFKLWEAGTTPDEYYAATRNFLDGSLKPHLALGKPVALTVPASAKYHGGDALALTDGIRGWNDYHMHWLGFEGEDMEATIDLGASQSVSQINTEFLQDSNSWVFMPLNVTFAVSDDGRQFQTVGEVTNNVPAQKDGAVIAPFNVQFQVRKARYIRVTARNMKVCPDWHKGAGGKAWIFCDEITVL